MNSTKFTFLLFSLFLIISCNKDDTPQEIIYPENICTGDYIILNQQELEEFGANNCTKIEGFLKISGVSDLTPLVALKEVSGDLFIGYDVIDETYNLVVYDNPELSSLHGLENIEIIGGRLNISLNNNLEEITNMNNLTFVGSGLLISRNDLIDNCFFNNLITIDENTFQIVNNNSLTNLDFPALEYTGNFIIDNNNILTTINFPNLTSVGLSVAIVVFQKPNTINLENLNTIARTFRIEGASQNSLNVPEINSATRIRLEECDVQNLDFLQSLNTLELLQITQCNNLNNIDELIGLNSITDEIDIWNNDLLTNLDGLTNATINIEDLFIESNPLLTDFCGLSGITVSDEYAVLSNAYNPTINQINSSLDCSN